ncbi:MAG: formylglycine-generating enzyme family protein [Prevotellaceae bacterium]|jgi:formylglycine-generating enzyme required for sulfatase activity|nr:formylglycine-generating enzyme family protein [Prevotellaceae bacterium]
MKKHVLLGICLLVAGVLIVAPGRVQAASMAVLVVGLETDAASDAFAEAIRYEYTQKGYTMVTGAAVLAKQTELRNLHKQNQPVDTGGLAAWGKTNNIDFVQLVVENDCTITINGVAKSGREQLAQVVRCGTAQYTGRGYYRTRFIPSSPNPNLGTGFEDMVHVTGGVFQMATNYYVQLSDFYIGKYMVTQGLWKKVMGSLPSSISGSLLGDDKPVVYVNYTDVENFFTALNLQTGKNYRLPTEAEWEYAARGCKAGNCDSYTYSGSNTLTDVSWYQSNCSALQVVGTKLPNGLGLYDMSGNANDWCYDWYGSYGTNTASSPAVNPTGPGSGTSRVMRGGNWFSEEYYHRVTYRHPVVPNDRYDRHGFRLV